MSSWGSSNYRPSAPLLYEVAGHVKHLPFRPLLLHTDSYEHKNTILYNHDNEQPIVGPNPQNASTPERQKRTQGNTTKGILINTNNVKSIEKATQLKATIHYSNPDIIFLVETKLDSNYQTYSFLPPIYVAIRNYRNAHGGGVLVAFRDDVTAESLDNLN